MANPAGNYPGRQIFLGGLDGRPAFVYLVTGRSDSSKQRYATSFIESESAIRIKPIKEDEPFDPFRHYQAVRIDPKTGLLVVSNSQAPNDAVFEAYSFMTDEEKLGDNYLARLIAAIGPEYDNKEKPTSRIVGVTFPLEEVDFASVLAITAKRGDGQQLNFRMPYTNLLIWVPTYNGDLAYRNFDPFILTEKKTEFHPSAKTAEELANEIYEISDYADPVYGDLRVCSVAGIRNGNGSGGWELARKNRHNVGD